MNLGVVQLPDTATESEILSVSANCNRIPLCCLPFSPTSPREVIQHKLNENVKMMKRSKTRELQGNFLARTVARKASCLTIMVFERAVAGRRMLWWQARHTQRLQRAQHTGNRHRTGKTTRFVLGGLAGTAMSTAAVAGYAAWDRKQLADDGVQIPLHYDPAAFAAHWDQHRCQQLARVGTIASRVLPFLTHSAWLYYFGPAHESDEDQTARQARWGADLRELLVDLGPTFIKFGQMLRYSLSLCLTQRALPCMCICERV